MRPHANACHQIRSNNSLFSIELGPAPNFSSKVRFVPGTGGKANLISGDADKLYPDLGVYLFQDPTN